MMPPVDDAGARLSPWATKVVKESGISVAGSVLGNALNYVLLLVLTRFLAPEQFGMFALAQSAVSVAIIFVLLGTPRALNRFLPYYIAEGAPDKAKAVLTGVIGLTTLLALGMFGLLASLSGWLAVAVFRNPELAPILRRMSLSIPLLAFAEVVTYAFAGLKELRYRVYTHQIAMPALKTGLALLAFSVGGGLIAWVHAYLGALFLVACFAGGLLAKHLVSRFRSVRAARPPVREIVAYSWPLTIQQLVLVLASQASIFLLGRYRPAGEVGVYRVYVYVLLVIVFLSDSFAQIYKPVASEYVAKRDRENTRALYERVGKWRLLGGSIIAIGIMILGGGVVRTFLPRSYDIATGALVILAGARLVVLSLGPQGAALEAFGHTRLCLLNAGLMLAATAGVGLLLVPRYGVYGAAIGAASGSLVAGAAGSIEMLRLHGLHPFRGGYWRVAASAGVAGCVTLAFRVLGAGDGLLGLAALGAILVGVYLAALRVSGALDAQDDYVLDRLRTRFGFGG